MAIDTIAPFVAKESTAMLFIVYDKPVLLVHMEGL